MIYSNGESEGQREEVKSCRCYSRLPISAIGCMKDKELKLEDVEVPASVPHTLVGASDTI